MISRRTVVGAFISTISSQRLMAAESKEKDDFDSLFSRAIANPKALLATRKTREGLGTELDLYFTKGIAPRYTPSDVKISNDAIKLIIAFEVTSQVAYIKHYQKPIWPKGQSGMTIGIGYDLGYVTKQWLHEDWGTLLQPDDLIALEKACGIKGASASKLIPEFASIDIGWNAAYNQFITLTLPRFTAEVLGVLPNADKIPSDCLGALVSLDYNRGPSFKSIGARYKEMNAIRLHMVNEKFDLVPGELRNMAKIWAGDPNMSGLVTRRYLEAALFEKGLNKS